MHYKLYMTAAQIKALASNPNHDAHFFLWNDGAQDWTLDALADALTHEALEGMGEESTITLEACDLSDAGRALYIQGFCDHAPEGYDGKKDMEVSPCPWCAPFAWYKYWRDTFTIAAQNAAWRPYTMGKLDAENCHAELAATSARVRMNIPTCSDSCLLINPSSLSARTTGNPSNRNKIMKKERFSVYTAGMIFPRFVTSTLENIIKQEKTLEKTASATCCIYSEKSGELAAIREAGQCEFTIR